VTVTDNRGEAALAKSIATLPDGVARELGGHVRATFESSDLIVVSPGVPEIPELQAARAAGVAITGELELASRFVAAPIVAITGTNGKSTTTTLCGSILAATGRPTFVGGNLGTPLAEAIGSPATSEAGYCVVEVSSFQLETTDTFRPRVAVLLNVTPDHLDRYDGMAGYAAAKERIFLRQNGGDFAVLNADDELVAAMAPRIRSHVVRLSTSKNLSDLRSGAAWVDGGALCVRLPGGAIEHYPADNPGLIGRHNRENALAALLAARLAGALPAEADRALHNFRALAHRMELVAESRGVAFFDDSKGTNVGATVAALTGFPRPVVLIAGGRDKGGSYAPLAEALRGQGRAVVVIGEAADRIADAMTNVLPVERAATMDEAVERANALARPGDAVVLSPACSSFDMFRDYEDRANAFRGAVRRVTGAGGSS
jgi:UDP-N-acetylmuramoylalanine--D-glutamate ligase